MGRIYRFADFELDEQPMELRRKGKPLEIQSKPLAILLHLVRNRHRLVTREELLRVVWNGVSVTDTSVGSALYALRQALGGRSEGRRCIATVRGRGYRFVGHVVEHAIPVPDEGEPHEASGAGAPPLDEERALRRTRAALATLGSARKRLLLVHGAPRSGKTRHLLELVRDAGAANVEVHLGRVSIGEEVPPLWPWIQVLRSLLRARGRAALIRGAGPAREALASVLPGVGSEPHREPLRAHCDRCTSGGACFPVLDGIASCLEQLARERPLVVLVDDLHAADEASHALLRLLVRGAPDASLLVVGTCRTQRPFSQARSARWLARLEREPGVELVPLAFDARLESGGLLAREDAWACVAELSEACQDALRAAAVIGMRVPIALLARTLSIDPDALVELLAEAEATDVLVFDGDGTCAFVNAALRDGLYGAMSGARRVRLHRAVGDALERDLRAGADLRASALAHHFAEAAPLGRAEQAVAYARRAAGRAGAAFAFGEAASHLRRALAAVVLIDPPDPNLHSEVWLELGEVLTLDCAPFDEIDEAFRAARRIARDHQVWDAFARAAVRGVESLLAHRALSLVGRARTQVGLAESRAALDEALARLPLREGAMRARLLLRGATVRMLQGDASSAPRMVQRAAKVARRSGDPGLHADLLSVQCHLWPVVDRLDDRISLCRLHTELAIEANDGTKQAFGHLIEASLELQRGDRSAAERAGRRLEALAREFRVPSVRALVCDWRALACQLDARLHQAAGWARRAVDLRRAHEREGRGPAPGGVRADRLRGLSLLQGWWFGLVRGESSSIVRIWERIAARRPDSVPAKLLLARLYAEVGDREHAQRCFEHADASAIDRLPRDDDWLFYVGLGADVAAELCDERSAPAILALLRPYVDRVMIARWFRVTTGSAARPAARLCALLGELGAAESLFERALASHTALAAPALIAWTHLDRGSSLADLDPARSREALEAASALAAPLGLGAVRARAERQGLSRRGAVGSRRTHLRIKNP